jgi:hypothetical protein
LLLERLTYLAYESQVSSVDNQLSEHQQMLKTYKVNGRTSELLPAITRVVVQDSEYFDKEQLIQQLTQDIEETKCRNAVCEQSTVEQRSTSF